MGEVKSSERMHQKALDIRRRLSHEQPRAFLPDVAASCNNLGLIYVNTGRYTEAKELFDEALDIYKEFSRYHPEAFLPCVAITYINLGSLLVKTDKFGDARQCFEEPLAICESLVDRGASADQYLPYTSIAHQNLGLILVDIGEYSKAANHLSESLASRLTQHLKFPRKKDEMLIEAVSAMRKLANKTDFEGRFDWLQTTWQYLLGFFNYKILNVCKPLGELFYEAGFWDLALEPYLLAYILLNAIDHQDKVLAEKDIAKLREKLGGEYEHIYGKLTNKFAPIVGKLQKDKEE